MSTPKLDNYLRTFRKKSGLTQRDVAFLLGCRNGAQVSRYEKRIRVPPLKTALACEAIFDSPISELFAGIAEHLRREVEKRLLKLKQELEDRPGRKGQAAMTARKLEWIKERRNNQLTDQTSQA